jgi:hypothetical protein
MFSAYARTNKPLDDFFFFATTAPFASINHAGF